MPAPSKRISAYVAGLGCPECIASVENMVYRMPGVTFVGVSLNSMKMTVIVQEAFDEAEMAVRLERLGYQVVDTEPLAQPLVDCACRRQKR